MTPLIIVFIFICALFCPSVATGQENVHTQCKNQQTKQNLFSKSSLEIMLCGDGKAVCFKSDGSYGVSDSSWNPRFQIKEGEMFAQAADHHAHTEFTLKKIKKDGVILHYENNFDHRSFGENLITTDSCDIFVPFIDPRAPEDFQPASEAGLYYMNQKEYEKAAEIFKKGIEQEPDEGFYYLYLGKAYFASGKMREAADAYEQYNKLKPNISEKAYEKLGDIYAELGEYQKAEENYMTAIDVFKKIPNPYLKPEPVNDWYIPMITEKIKQLPQK